MLGYTDIGLDDGWELCGAGVNGSYHDPTGKVIVNTTRFPSLKELTSGIHSLNLTAGWCVF
jgi:alpha-galactosidase